MLTGVPSQFERMILSSELDGIVQITQILAAGTYQTLHLVSHGMPGHLYLGATVLNHKTLNHYQELLSQWHVSEILIYGCAVGADQTFLQALHQLTGARIAAARQPVGNPQLGGLWELGCRVGEIVSNLAFSPVVRNSYSGIFAYFNPANNIPVGNTLSSLAIGDFNGDNIPDLVVANDNSLLGISLTGNLFVLEGDGNGGFSIVTDQGVGRLPASLAVGDFNGDNIDDIATVYIDDILIPLFGLLAFPKAAILLGNGNSGFSSINDFTIGNAPSGVAVGDFNGDNRLDLITTNRGDNNASVLLGNGTGGINSNTNIGAGTNPNGVIVADVNGDNIPDIAIANGGNNNVSVRLGNGSGGFSAAQNFAVGMNPRAIVVGDLNGDNIPDLVTANGGSGNISILLGNGSGGFSASQNFAVGANPSSVTIGDVNANQGSNNVSVLLGDGNGGFSVAQNFAVGAGPVGVALGDFNGDDRLDIATANKNSVSILLNLTPQVSIAAGTNPEEEGMTPGTLNITLDQPVPPGGITLQFEMGGNALNPDDYSLISQDPNLTIVSQTSVSLAAGITSATLTILPVDDLLVEPDETIEFTLTHGEFDCYFIDETASSATLIIIDNDLPIVNVTSLSHGEETDETPGKLEFTLDQSAPDDITISYTVGGNATPGTDYQPLSGTVLFLAGETEVTVDVIPLEDQLVELDETVEIFIDSGTDYNIGIDDSATVIIFDNDLPLVNVTTLSHGAETDSTPGQLKFTFDQSSPAPVTIPYSLSGSATPGTDYQPLSGSITMPPGETSVILEVIPIDDLEVELDETVEITILASSDYEIGINNQASLIIFDNDVPTVNVMPGINPSEPDGAGTLIFTLNQPGTAPIHLTYSVGGSATPGADYQPLSGSVTFAVGETSVIVPVIPIDDLIVDPDETIIIALNAGAGYNLSANRIATLVILDDDIANTPPIANPDSATTLVNTPVSIPVLANDSDPDGDSFSLTDFTQGEQGSVSLNTGIRISPQMIS